MNNINIYLLIIILLIIVLLIIYKNKNNINRFSIGNLNCKSTFNHNIYAPTLSPASCQDVYPWTNNCTDYYIYTIVHTIY